MEKERWVTSHGWYHVDSFGKNPWHGEAEENVLSEKGNMSRVSPGLL